MQIQCPACETSYEIPNQIKAGRTVQCASCGVKWAPVPAAIAPRQAMPGAIRPAPAVMAPELEMPTPGLVASPSPDARPPSETLPPTPPMTAARTRRVFRLPAWIKRARRPRPDAPQSVAKPSGARPSWALAAAWVLSVALVIGLVAFAILQRAPVMLAWPPSTRLFAALGLH